RRAMSEPIVKEVQAKYASVARSGLSSEHAGVRAVAEAFGYTPEELASIPAGANMGLSCGNPTAFASLRPGETVVDLGCGGGLAGAISFDEYRQWLEEAGFAGVQIIDTRKDLNAYAQVENQSGCCSPAAACCPPTQSTSDLHEDLAALLRKYDANDYAASVQV